MRDRHQRISTIQVNNQTGLRQVHTSPTYHPSRRIIVQRSDQICAYPRRSYIRSSYRYDPYALPTIAEPKLVQVDSSDSIHSMEEKSIDSINPDFNCVFDDQFVTPDDRLNKRRLPNNIPCQYCSQKFKNKQQLTSHLSKCHADLETK